MDERTRHEAIARRALLAGAGGGLGLVALAQLARAGNGRGVAPRPDAIDLPHHAPRARRVIWLFQSGGPSHPDLFDFDPELRRHDGIELPDSVRGGQRVSGQTAFQKSFPVQAPRYAFERCGPSGTWISELLPHTRRIAGRICVLKAMHVEAVNHDPALTWMCTGLQRLGGASAGAWIDYGLGSENADLPAFVVLLSQGSGLRPGQPIFSRLWGSGFLPSVHQGVQLRSSADPVLYLSDPPGIGRADRRSFLDRLARLERLRAGAVEDERIESQVARYEMAFRMQASVPELVDLGSEPASTLERYGPDARTPGTFAYNCILARRLAERDVRFVQLFHRGWDQHNYLDRDLRAQCRDTDQPSAALIEELAERGLLEDTLVLWGGEFGRGIYVQGLANDPKAGRDHHGRCFSMWLAGGGLRAGFEHGRTDEFAYNVIEGGVHVRDLHATLLHLLGIDHARLRFEHQGLEQRLTGVEEPARLVTEILA